MGSENVQVLAKVIILAQPQCGLLLEAICAGVGLGLEPRLSTFGGLRCLCGQVSGFLSLG